MGLFSSKYTSEEKRIMRTHIDESVATGLSKSQAKQSVTATLDEAIQRSKQAGTYSLPMGLGDKMLDDKLPPELIKLKKDEGVTDEDIAFWWNMSDVERYFFAVEDESFRLAALKHHNDNGLPREKAGEEVRKGYPIFGDPADITHTKGDDRPLPFELKLRINDFFNASAGNPQALERIKAEKGDRTMNAYIRDKIRAGAI